MKTIAIVGTFDTKGKKLKFIKDLVEKQGLVTLCIHTVFLNRLSHRTAAMPILLLP